MAMSSQIIGIVIVLVFIITVYSLMRRIMMAKIIPQAIKNLKFPAEFQWADLPEEKLTESGRAFFQDLDDKMRQLYFEPVKTFSLLGFAQTSESKIYCNSVDGISLLASHIAAPNREVLYYEFITRFMDGTSLSTTNMGGQRSVLPVPEYESIERLPSISDPAKLLEYHRKTVEKSKAKGLMPVYTPAEQTMLEMKNATRRRMEYYEQKGLLKFDQIENVYRPTPKLIRQAASNPKVSVKVTTRIK
jgi:hypothetical protein